MEFLIRQMSKPLIQRITIYVSSLLGTLGVSTADIETIAKAIPIACAVVIDVVLTVYRRYRNK
jgi:hypothetical protein